MAKSLQQKENEKFAEGPDGYPIIRVSVVDSKATYMTNDIHEDNNTNTTYIGKENGDGVWMIIRKIENNGITEIRAASQKNNPSITTYADAWSNRTSLTYGYLKEVL